MGTALLAVVLEHELVAASSGGAGAGSASDVATAFGHSFWWAVGLSVLAIIPAAILAITQRRERDAAASEPGGAAAAAAGPAG